jgi:hypothetical protein
MLTFYGLLYRMMPIYAQEWIGQALLQRTYLSGTKEEIQTAVAQARTLVLKFWSTSTSFLTEFFEDMRFIIIDRMVHCSPV